MVGKQVSLQLAVISGVTAFLSPGRALKLTLCLCFHLFSHPSESQKSVNSRHFVRLRAFSLMMIPLTGMLVENALLFQVKTTWSRSLLSLLFNFFRHEFTWPNSYGSKIFLLFAIHVEKVFFFTQYSSGTLFFVLFPSSIFCKVLHFSVIKMFTLFIFHSFSGALHCLWKIKILLL